MATSSSDSYIDTAMLVKLNLMQNFYLLPVWRKPFFFKWCSSKKKVPSQFILKPRANRRNIVGQQLPTLLNVTCFVPLHTLLHVVGSCCAKFEIGQTTEPTTQHFFCSLIARSIAQKCWIRLHSSSNIVGVTHAHLKGFKAWVKGFGAYEWLAISLARRPRTK